MFEVFYNLSVGIERLMQIAIILLEHDDACDQEAFENSLVTHNHQALLGRIQNHKDIKFSKQESAFLHLLTRFYENLRYDRFSLRGSKAATVFLGKADIPAEDILWKELLIFFMNTKETSGYLEFP